MNYRCPIPTCSFVVQGGGEDRWTLYRHLITTDTEHTRLAGGLATFMDKDADRVFEAVQESRRQQISDLNHTGVDRGDDNCPECRKASELQSQIKRADFAHGYGGS